MLYHKVVKSFGKKSIGFLVAYNDKKLKLSTFVFMQLFAYSYLNDSLILLHAVFTKGNSLTCQIY